MTPEQEQKLNELYEFMNQLKASQTIPKDVGDAVRERTLNGFVLEIGSGQAASSYLQTVNEEGAATYNVLGVPTQMVNIKVKGRTALVPDFS